MVKLIQLITLLFVFLTMKTFGAEGWCLKTFEKDSKNHYYVGLSDGSKSLEKAMQDAYNNAVAEAIRHNFGFEHKHSEAVFSSAQGIDTSSSSQSKFADVAMVGIIPDKVSRHKNDNGTWLVCRRIKYSIKAIQIAKKGIKSKRPAYLNKYGNRSAKGALRVETIPVNANIHLTALEDNMTIEGTGPAKLHAPLGSYILTVNQEGYLSAQREIVLTGKLQETYIVLKKATGKLVVETTPSDAQVYINSIPVEKVSYELISNQEYEIKVTHPDYLSQSQTVILTEGDYRRLSMNLEGKKGRVTVYSSPAGADVYINGTKRGITPLKNIKLSARMHNIRISKNGYRSKISNLNISPNRVHPPVEATLQKTYSKTRRVEPPRPHTLPVLEFSYHPFRYDTQAGPISTHRSVGLEVFLFKNLSITGDYVRSLSREDSEEQQSSVDARHYSAGAKLYLYRGKSFSIGGGVEGHTLGVKREKTTYGETDVKKSRATGSGYYGSMSFHLFNYKDSKIGIQTVYRQFELGSKEHRQTSIGFTIGF